MTLSYKAFQEGVKNKKLLWVIAYDDLCALEGDSPKARRSEGVHQGAELFNWRNVATRWEEEAQEGRGRSDENNH
ncbi:hypothetical protein TIFTF001_017353 [Ficus carica]|uniref:Uncharacterized protein n=1 Tax=Ficus carica TaxID=3494 RepID=A0AA88AU98_FICCA|nr:hypothetical protein TIFTF001_017353 [Ficus carica]